MLRVQVRPAPAPLFHVGEQVPSPGNHLERKSGTAVDVIVDLDTPLEPAFQIHLSTHGNASLGKDPLDGPVSDVLFSRLRFVAVDEMGQGNKRLPENLDIDSLDRESDGLPDFEAIADEFEDSQFVLGQFFPNVAQLFVGEASLQPFNYM